MDRGYSVELDSYRAEVRAFIEEHAPRIRIRRGVRAPEPGDVPALRAWNARLYAVGYFGADWPERWGGRGVGDPERQIIVVEELARAEAPTLLGMGALAAGALLHFGTEEQQARYLPGIRSGEQLWCQLFSEPGAGSDLASLQTRARRDGDTFVVDGQKVWTTNGQYADFGFLLARTDPTEKHAGITAFALDMRSPGVDVRPLREITGTSDFNEVFLDGVEVPAANVIGQVGGGWNVATASLVHERHATGGNATRLKIVLEELIDLARRSRRAGYPALENHEVRQTIARFHTEVRTCQLLTQLTQSNTVLGRPRPQDAPVGKIAFSELNLAMAEYGLDLQGPSSLLVEGDADVVDEGRWQDAYLYARAYTIAGGSNEIMRNMIAERGLGLPRDSSNPNK